jgi:hypothetical protein
LRPPPASLVQLPNVVLRKSNAIIGPLKKLPLWSINS